MTELVWFRSDLRVDDNAALAAACAKNQPIVAIYISCPRQWKRQYMSAIQADLIYRRLQELSKSLAKLGITFLHLKGSDYAGCLEIIQDVCQHYPIENLYYNHEYPLNERSRDTFIASELKGVNCYGYDSNLLYPPNTILNKKKEMYKVFTAFSRALYRHLHDFLPQIATIKRSTDENNHLHNEQISAFDYPRQDSGAYLANECEIQQKMHDFIEQSIIGYAENRDFPSMKSSSELSAYLAIGAISVKQCFTTLQTCHPQFWLDYKTDSYIWFNELIWREFYHNLINAHDKLSTGQPFIAWTESINWSDDIRLFEKWTQGKTGFPIVDAAMKQLNSRGWMHNRLRMIVASFLVKDLHIDWRKGEQYFMEQLIDGDFASNNGGWQWAASTGMDAVPYFRIFNPSTQSHRFDPEGRFIKQWLPELANVPLQYIHAPSKWSAFASLDYPEPIINHAEARKITLKNYKEARQWYDFSGIQDDH